MQPSSTPAMSPSVCVLYVLATSFSKTTTAGRSVAWAPQQVQNVSRDISSTFALAHDHRPILLANVPVRSKKDQANNFEITKLLSDLDLAFAIFQNSHVWFSL